MERFYRYMRKKHHILMEGEQPEGGEWNYDKSNRNKWKGSPGIPPFIQFNTNVESILNAIQSSGVETIGRFKETTFSYPVNRAQSLQQLEYFNQHLLVHFGDYQDALHTDEVYLGYHESKIVTRFWIVGILVARNNFIFLLNIIELFI